MIDIIIPAYNSHKTIRKTLLSIAKQDNIEDIKTYIVNDCSKKDYSEEVNTFKNLMFIEEIDLPVNSGPGAAREYGVEHTDSEFIIFMDSDDLFYADDSCKKLRDAIEGYDMSKGGIIEDRGDGTNIEDYEDEYSLHGKLYRRSIIKKNKIKFDPFRSKEANAHEDNSYNNLYELCCDKINKIYDLVYKYEYNIDSITKTEISQVKGMENYIRAMEWLADEVEKRKIKNKADIERRFAFVITYCFFTYLCDPDNYEFMFKKMSKIKKIYDKYYVDIEYRKLVEIYNMFKYPVIPYMTIYEFISRIED